MNRQQRRASKGNGTGNGAGNGTGGGSDDSRLDQAMALHQAGRLMEADAHYRQILEQHPTDPNALRLRGALAYQLGNPAAAAELLARAFTVQA
mgnify:FL=1